MHPAHREAILNGWMRNSSMGYLNCYSVIYLSMQNDLSFIVGAVLNLYEHQSTLNPNMPVRGLSYFARLYEAYISRNDLDIYGTSLISLPRPQYIVFYNGRGVQPDEQVLRLSDAFEQPGSYDENIQALQEPALECCVRVLNINLGHNEELMKGCRRLWEYASFVGEVNQNLDSGCRLEEALEKAMDDCIQKGILKDIFIRSRSEVLQMLLTEYNAKKHLQNIYEEGRKSGLEQGRFEGLEQGRFEGLEQGRFEGLEQGRFEGLEQGRAEGQDLLMRIMRLNHILIETGQMDDLKRALDDEKYREQLLEKYKL